MIASPLHVIKTEEATLQKFTSQSISIFFQESRKNFDQILEFFRKLEVNLRAFSGISNSIFGFLLGLQKLASKLARSVQ